MNRVVGKKLKDILPQPQPCVFLYVMHGMHCNGQINNPYCSAFINDIDFLPC